VNFKLLKHLKQPKNLSSGPTVMGMLISVLAHGAEFQGFDMER
jgi:hypothetical protein